MSVRVRMAPSPTGFLHIGSVRTFLFNWLYARGQGGECLLRIENTDTSREVEEAVEQIQRSLRWVGIDWDGEVTFQLDRAERCREEAHRLVEAGAAYEDEGAIRFRMPDEGVTGWDDAIRGRIEFDNAELEDLVLVRSDGRPTYNFASPVEDWLDGITHVIRGDDHISNTPKQIRILTALGSELPLYAHVPMINGPDGRKLSKRHGAVSTDEFRNDGYLPEALMNFLALLGWAPDGETTIMSADELRERFSLERVGASAATFDYEKLDWMNGVYLRALPVDEYAARLVSYLGEQGYDWPDDLVRASAPLVREKIERLGQFPAKAGFLFGEVEPDPALLDRTVLDAAAEAFEALDAWDAAAIEVALKELCERLEMKPRQAFQPIRVAVTGSNGLAWPLREPRGARPRGVSRARQACGRGGRSGLGGAERVERPLELQPGTASEARRGLGQRSLPVGRARKCAVGRRFSLVRGERPGRGKRYVRREPAGESRAESAVLIVTSTRPAAHTGQTAARAPPSTRRTPSISTATERTPRPAWSCGETAAAVASSRWKARRTPNRAPRHSQTSGSAAAGPASSTTSAIWAVSSRAIASATCSSSWGSSRPSSGWIPSARSAATWSAYCRCGNSSSSSSCADGSAATDSRARRVGPSSRRR